MPRKGENIYKRKDGRWEARYVHHYENNKPKYRYLYGKTYSEVKAKRMEDISKHTDVIIAPTKSQAGLDELCTVWLQNKRAKVKESTLTRYDRTVRKYILGYFEKERISKIDGTAVMCFYNLLNEKLSCKTVSDIMCIFKSIWHFGALNGYSCCSFEIPNEKIKTGSRVNVIPPETRRKIESALLKNNDPASMGILFALFTGVRIGEICGLKWGDFDFLNGYVYIRRTVERIADLDNKTQRKTKVVITEPKTENSIRVIPLPEFLIEYVMKYRASDEKYILTGSTKHTEPHTYYSRYKTFLRKYNLGDFTFHELRHTFATECVEKGFDIKSLSEILGHSNVSTTMNLYVHPTLQMKKRQMELLNFTC